MPCMERKKRKRSRDKACLVSTPHPLSINALFDLKRVKKGVYTEGYQNRKSGKNTVFN